MSTSYQARTAERDRALAALANPELTKLADAIAKAVRAEGGSDEDCVKAIRELIIGKPTLGDAIAKSLANPLTAGGESVVVKAGEPLGSLPVGARTLDAGAFIDGLAAAGRLRKRADERMEEQSTVVRTGRTAAEAQAMRKRREERSR